MWWIRDMYVNQRKKESRITIIKIIIHYYVRVHKIKLSSEQNREKEYAKKIL